MKRRTILAGAAALTLSPNLSRANEQGTPVGADKWAHPDWFAAPTDLMNSLTDVGQRVIALTPIDEFRVAHVPTSSQLDWPDLALTDSASATVETWQATVTQELGLRGVRPDSDVVIYDGGTFYAARLWWILELLGHENKRIIDGGMPAWIEAKGPVDIGSPMVAPGSVPYQATPNMDVLATVADVENAVTDMSRILVDARSADEYAKGHIPGAVNVPFIENAEPESGGKWKAPDVLREMYEAVGVTPDQSVIPYCSTGVRSANTYFTLRALGFEDVKLFSGSFAEWTSDPGRPVETS